MQKEIRTVCYDDLHLEAYRVPVITVVTSVIVLKEESTWMAAIGIGLTLIGLFLSESKLKFKKRGKQNECRE